MKKEQTHRHVQKSWAWLGGVQPDRGALATTQQPRTSEEGVLSSSPPSWSQQEGSGGEQSQAAIIQEVADNGFCTHHQQTSAPGPEEDAVNLPSQVLEKKDSANPMESLSQSSSRPQYAFSQSFLLSPQTERAKNKIKALSQSKQDHLKILVNHV